MVENNHRYLLLLALLLSVTMLPAAEECEPVFADTVFVFRKMPADTVVAKRQPKSSAKKKRTTAKSGSVKKKAVKKSVKPKQVKQKNDSVKYTPLRYSLGDRVLMRGDSGADVKKLAEIMVRHLYMEETAVPYTKSGQVLYDGELLRAVKLFQKVSGLYDDGIVGETTIKALRKIHRWRRTSH
ncbi:MAG: hypothetical protein IKL54_01720 [Bacteroidaceae bacterium]|nr:hypothetical protein [Bacteroidaceae bacterium]